MSVVRPVSGGRHLLAAVCLAAEARTAKVNTSHCICKSDETSSIANHTRNRGRLTFRCWESQECWRRGKRMSCGTYSSKGQQLSSRQVGTCPNSSRMGRCGGPLSWLQAQQRLAALMLQRRLMANRMQLGLPVPARLVGAVGAATEARLQHTTPYHLSAAVFQHEVQAGADCTQTGAQEQRAQQEKATHEDGCAIGVVAAGVCRQVSNTPALGGTSGVGYGGQTTQSQYAGLTAVHRQPAAGAAVPSITSSVHCAAHQWCCGHRHRSSHPLQQGRRP